jgi:hypothetical protein
LEEEGWGIKEDFEKEVDKEKLLSLIESLKKILENLKLGYFLGMIHQLVNETWNLVTN